MLKGSPFAIGIAPGLADAAKSSATIEAAGRSERRLEVGIALTPVLHCGTVPMHSYHALGAVLQDCMQHVTCGMQILHLH